MLTEKHLTFVAIKKCVQINLYGSGRIYPVWTFCQRSHCLVFNKVYYKSLFHNEASVDGLFNNQALTYIHWTCA